MSQLGSIRLAPTIARPAKTSAFFDRRVYSDLAGDDGFRWLTRSAGLGAVGRGWTLRRFSFACGHRHVGLCVAHMLAGCHVVGYAEAAHAEEPEQAAALL